MQPLMFSRKRESVLSAVVLPILTILGGVALLVLIGVVGLVPAWA